MPQGGSYAQVHDSFDGTTAQILGGTDQSTATDVAGRALTRDVTTGWSTDGAHADLASNVFTLWGMSDVGAQTSDTYALSLSYSGGGHDPVLVTKNAEHRWVNAVKANNGGAATFVSGPWKSSYGLGAYGVDQATHTAWAVVNHTGSFAVQHAQSYQH